MSTVKTGTEILAQLQLLPDEPLELTPATLTLASLDHIAVPEPTAELVENIKAVGLLQYPIFRRNEDGQIDIVFGRRRLGAVRKLGWMTIPAMMVDTNMAIADVMTIAENAIRRANVISEFDAIERLSRTHSIKMISGATGMPQQTIKKRQELLRLAPSLTEAFRAGKMTVSVAEGAAKLPKTLQEELALTYVAKGKVVASDLKEVKLARTQRAMAAAPELDLSSVDYGEGERDLRVEEPPIELVLADELQAIIARMPSAQGVLIRSLQWVAEMLTDIGMGGTPDLSEKPAFEITSLEVVSVDIETGEPTITNVIGTRQPIEIIAGSYIDSQGNTVELDPKTISIETLRESGTVATEETADDDDMLFSEVVDA